MLTPSQQRALDTTRHLSVTANAGSGKTRVLVERYLAVLLSGLASVKEIVALTFTEKAASEINRKIAERLLEKTRSASTRPERKRLEEIRSQLSTAYIGTIHSFCARILHEYPVEAGVDAAFAVIEQVDSEELLEEAIRETFENILRKPGREERREEVLSVLRSLGKFRVLTIIRKLADKRDMVERWITPDGLYSLPDVDVRARWRATISTYVDGELNNGELQSDLLKAMDLARGTQVSVARDCFEEFLGSHGREKKRASYQAMIEKVLTTQGKFFKAFLGEVEGRIVESLARRIHARHRILRPLISFLMGGSSDGKLEMLLKMSRSLLTVYQEVSERYEQKKLEKGLLDFEDLQLRMKYLLKRQSINERLAHRFKYVMVDEYQDTNLLQYEILLPLVSELSGGNLFIVGDPKQSIYGFRNANVAVFELTKRDICRVSGVESEVVLSESFRPLRDVAAFVNHVFSSIMKASESSDGVFYDPLVKTRQSKGEGRVEIIVVSSNGGDEAASLTEGDLLARRILQLHSTGYEVYDKEEKPHPLRFADIAILLRSRSPLSGIEEAFIRSNIPFIVTGGVGYFQSQDTYDFYNYLHFLLAPDDDVALVGTLRSPFFHVSDAELFEVASEWREQSLWKYLLSNKSKYASIRSLHHAIEVLSDDLEVGLRLTAPELISRIVEQTSYAAIIAGTPLGEQSQANLEKLQQLARRFDAQGFTTLFDFVKRLKRLIDEEEEEGQAAIDLRADAVQIMTVHAAKGLEFPVVIIPALDRSLKVDVQPYFDEELGMGFDPDPNGEGSENASIVEYMKHKARGKMISEEKRIFYVACTRARDMLILSGANGVSRGQETWMSWLLDALGVEDDIDGAGLEFQVVTDSLVSRNGRFLPVTDQHRLRVAVLRPEDLHVEFQHATPPIEVGKFEQIAVEPLRSTPKGEIISASKVVTYLECPSKYYLRYVLGLPESSSRMHSDHEEDDRDTGLRGDLRGRVFHAVMQEIDRLANEGDILDEARSCLARLDVLSRLEMAHEAEVVEGMVRKVTSSQFWSEVRSGSGTQTEFSITAPFGEDLLTGNIDRLYQDANGLWTVIDFKTDAVTKESYHKQAMRYESQMKFYSLLVSKLFSVTSVQTLLLFTALPQMPYRTLYSMDDIEEYSTKLAGIMRNIKSGIFPVPPTPCLGCPLLPAGCPQTS